MTAHARVVVLIFGCLMALGRLAAAQPQAELAFEVASVRPSQSCPLGAFGGRFEQRPGGRVVATCTPIRELVRVAFGLGRFQQIRGPAVLDQLVDLQATAPEGYDTVAALRAVVPTLVRSLLAERFQMSARVESAEAPCIPSHAGASGGPTGSANQERGSGRLRGGACG
jgi:hypothetical protein